MNDKSTADGLDPEIRAFVKRMGELWREHPPLAPLPVPEQRRIAEKVRAHWAQGGPKMARTSEHHVPVLEGGTVRIRVLTPSVIPAKVGIHADSKIGPGLRRGDGKREGNGAALPALLYLHGGGWTLFSIDTHDRIMREYAARAGIVVIGIDYSLSPEARFPRALNETVAVVRWLSANGASIGVNAGKLAIGGDSAGAALTIGACVVLRDAGESDAVKAMLLNYGAFDFNCDTESARRYGRGGYLWDSGEMDLYWRNYLRDPADSKNPLAVPILAELKGLPPAFLAVPECDVLYDASIAMGDRLRRSGVLAQTVIYPGATHSFLEAVSIARVADRAFDEASRWLSDTLSYEVPSTDR